MITKNGIRIVKLPSLFESSDKKKSKGNYKIAFALLMDFRSFESSIKQWCCCPPTLFFFLTSHPLLTLPKVKALFRGFNNKIYCLSNYLYHTVKRRKCPLKNKPILNFPYNCMRDTHILACLNSQHISVYIVSSSLSESFWVSVRFHSHVAISIALVWSVWVIVVLRFKAEVLEKRNSISLKWNPVERDCILSSFSVFLWIKFLL